MPKKQVAQFGPTILAAWEKAIKSPEGFSINCGTGEEGRKKAVTVRYRMYMLRTAMQKENHPLYESAKRITLRLRPKASGHFVEADYGDADLEDVFKASGIGVPETPDID